MGRSFVLTAWSSCGGPRRSAASELAVAPSTTPSSPSSNAWPARPRHALSRHILRLTSLRALCSVPSGAVVCAHLAGHGALSSRGAALLLETGAELLLGPTEREILVRRVKLHDRHRLDGMIPMALSKEALAEQRRVNGRKSLGPISVSGKRASSMNALTHGMRAEKLFLPSESPEMIQEHVTNWIHWYQPESPASIYLMQQCIYATLVSRRTWLALMSATTSQVEDADLAWNQDRNALVAGQSAALPTQPAAALAALKSTGHGCRFVLQSLRDLGDMFSRDGSWPMELAGAVVNLFGAESGIDQLGRNGRRRTASSCRTFIASSRRTPETAGPDCCIAKLKPRLELRRRRTLRDVDLRSWLPGRAVCREWLRGLLAAEIESVSLLEQALRTGKDASDHERLMDQANLLPEGELSRQVLRYRRKDADSKFLKKRQGRSRRNSRRSRSPITRMMILTLLPAREQEPQSPPRPVRPPRSSPRRRPRQSILPAQPLRPQAAGTR